MVGMMLLNDDSVLAFYAGRRNNLNRHRLRYPTESLFLIGPTDKLPVHKLGIIRQEFEGAIFLSHTGDDQDFIETHLLKPLRSQSRRPVFFHNRKTEGSEVYEHTVGHALLVSGSALVVLSNSCKQSKWVPKEIDIIFARKIPVIFFVRDSVSPADIHPDIPNQFGWWDNWRNRRYIVRNDDDALSITSVIRYAQASTAKS